MIACICVASADAVHRRVDSKNKQHRNRKSLFFIFYHLRLFYAHTHKPTHTHSHKDFISLSRYLRQDRIQQARQPYRFCVCMSAFAAYDADSFAKYIYPFFSHMQRRLNDVTYMMRTCCADSIGVVVVAWRNACTAQTLSGMRYSDI